MSTQKTPPAEDAVLEQGGIEWDLFWHLHKSKILLGVVVFACVAGGSFVGYISNALTTRAAVSRLATARDMVALEALVKEYPRSMPAADALLQIAADQRAAGKSEESTATFKKFIAAFPSHPLAGGALLGIGQNLDAAGNSKGAQETYQQVVVRYPKSYAAAFASYCEAEILLREFRKDEARRVLESLLVQFPSSQVASMASAQLARIGIAKGANGAKPAPGAVVPQ